MHCYIFLIKLTYEISSLFFIKTFNRKYGRLFTVPFIIYGFTISNETRIKRTFCLKFLVPILNTIRTNEIRVVS